MPSSGKRNLITDVDGLLVGNATDENVATGVTVITCAERFTASADVRGGAPGIRETETLNPENLIGGADAIVLTGGSVFGLGAADGVATTLSSAGIGVRLRDKGPAVPIVPAAVLFDLQNEGDKNWDDNPPYDQLGREACHNAVADFDIGNVGAGRGAMAGIVKGGLGSASITLDDGITIGAIVAVNPVGSVFMPDGKTFYAKPWELGSEFGGGPSAAGFDVPDPFPALSRLGGTTKTGENTVIAVVATDADLSNAEARRMAMMAHDGIARAVRPAHTPFDGDTIFSVATGRHAVNRSPESRALTVAAIGAASADCLARAIARGVYAARPVAR